MLRAIEDNNIEEIEALLAAETDISSKKMHATDALLSTVSKIGRSDISKIFIEAGADVNHQYPGHWTALDLASYYDDTPTIKILVDAGANIEFVDVHGYTCLHVAAQINSIDAIKMLITIGAEVNVADKDGCTPLHIAIIKGWPDAISALLDGGADRTMETKNENNAAQLAAGMYTTAYYLTHPVKLS